MDATQVVERWFEAMEQLDAERALGLFADDVTVHVEAMRQPIRGKDLARQSLASFLPACEAVQIQCEKVVASGQDVAVLVRAKAKMRADVELLGERLPTRGKELSSLAALFVTVNDEGRIASVTRVRDNWTTMRQLGFGPERMQSLVQKTERAMEGAPPR